MKVISFFKGDGHRWHHVEATENVETWLKDKFNKLKKAGQEVNWVDDDSFEHLLPNNQGKVDKNFSYNTLIYKIVP